jgi:hypothetical protein
MFEIHEAVEGVLMRGLIKIEQLSSHMNISEFETT